MKLFTEEVDGHLQLMMLKKLTFWAAHLVPDLLNCKQKPFIITVLMNANRLLTYVGHIHGWLE